MRRDGRPPGRRASRHRGPKTARRSDVALRGAAVSVVGGPGLAVGTAARVQAALHGPHATHPHRLVERVAFVLQGRQVKICNIDRFQACSRQQMGMGGVRHASNG